MIVFYFFLLKLNLNIFEYAKLQYQLLFSLALGKEDIQFKQVLYCKFSKIIFFLCVVFIYIF